MRGETKQLTSTQQRALDQIRNYIKDHGYAPSIKELAEMLHLSRSNTHRYLWVLKDKGHITFNVRKSRTIIII